ncbi:MAG TPA: hypothetical protein PKL15_09685 [Saprospiraceae bacterium]|nr:hypothetical protein [Saprospiraceae bacterium]
MKPVLKAVCTLLVVPMFAHAELKSMEDTEMSESVGRDGINVLMDLRMTGSMAYFQEKGGDTNSVSFTNFALNGEGVNKPGVAPATVWTEINVADGALKVDMPTVKFSMGVQDFEMRRGIRGDGTAANVSRFGSVYAIGFDMSKSYMEFSGH